MFPPSLLALALLTLGLPGSTAARAGSPVAPHAAPRPGLALQFGHMAPVSAVAFSPDGRFLVSGGLDRTLRVWDARTGELLRVFPTSAATKSLAVSPDSKRVAIDCGRELAVYDLASGGRIWTGTHEFQGGTFLAFAPNGSTLTTDCTTAWEVWDANTGNNLHYDRTPPIRSGALSPDGSLLAVGGKDAICLWDMRERTFLQTLPPLSAEVTSLAFSPDGTTLASASSDVRLWDVRTRVSRRRLGTRATLVAFSPDGGTLATTGTDRRLRWWEAGTGTLLRESAVPGGQVLCLAYSPDGGTVVTGSDDTQIRLWDARTGKLRQTLDGQTEAVASLAFSPDGKSLATGGGRVHGSVRLWDPHTGELRKALAGHAAWVMSVAYSADGRTLATAGSRYFAEVKLWDARTGALLRTLGPHLGYVRAVAFSPDGTILAAGTYKRLRLWNPTTGELLHTIDAHEGWVTGVAFSPDGTTLATVSGDHTIRLWDPRTGRLRLALPDQGTWIASVAFSPDGRLLATGCWDGGVRLWGTASWTLARVLRGPNRWVNAVAFSPGGEQLATGTSTGAVELWDSQTGECRRVLGRHEDMVYTVAFSPDGSLLASSGPDGAIKLWDVKSARLRASLIAVPPSQMPRPIKADARPIKADIRPVTVGPQAPREAPGDEDYLILTPEGYYSGSAAADRYIRFRLAEQLFPAECFQAPYYRPDLVRQSLAGKSVPAPRPGRGAFPPQVSFASPAGNDPLRGDHLAVTLQATDDTAINRVELFVNGARAGVRAEPLDSPAGGRKRRFVASVAVPPGSTAVRLQAVAFDEDGLQSPRTELQLTRTGTAGGSGRLLGLCIGVSRYQDPRLNLKYADADAAALGAELSLQRGIYWSARVRVLTDEQATRAAVAAALDQLAAQATRSDTVVLFLAGHGWRDQPAAGLPRFYFATSDVRRHEVARTALPWSDLARRLGVLSRRSRRVLVLLDACHSGSAATNEELIRSLLNASAGALVFASSRGSEVSLEIPDLRHGAFTSALLEALAGRAAPEGEKAVSLWDLATYVRRRVKELTGGAQNPQIPLLHDFDADAPIVLNR